MMVLSSGVARAPGQAGYISGGSYEPGTKCSPPAGYPKQSSTCSYIDFASGINDPAALEVEIRVPTNAKSFSFDFNFYTWEYPGWICSQYNDFYVTLMWPQVPGLPDANISFDSLGNPVSVNNGMLEVCSAGYAGGKYFTCPFGTAELSGTGFEGHAATGWLRTKAPAQPGSTIKIRFAIWDQGDEALDSTVLIDNFVWDTESSEVGTGRPL